MFRSLREKTWATSNFGVLGLVRHYGAALDAVTFLGPTRLGHARPALMGCVIHHAP